MLPRPVRVGSPALVSPVLLFPETILSIFTRAMLKKFFAIRSLENPVSLFASQALALKHVEEEINMAMQRRLAAADSNLRKVLDLVGVHARWCWIPSRC